MTLRLIRVSTCHTSLNRRDDSEARFLPSTSYAFSIDSLLVKRRTSYDIWVTLHRPHYLHQENGSHDARISSCVSATRYRQRQTPSPLIRFASSLHFSFDSSKSRSNLQKLLGIRRIPLRTTMLMHGDLNPVSLSEFCSPVKKEDVETFWNIFERHDLK